MATITPVSASANTIYTYAAASGGGDSIAGGTSQRITLLVRNASGGSINTTLAAVNACSQGFLHNTVVACGIGDTEILIPAACITAAGAVGVTYSATTSITVAAVTS